MCSSETVVLHQSLFLDMWRNKGWNFFNLLSAGSTVFLSVRFALTGEIFLYNCDCDVWKNICKMTLLQVAGSSLIVALMLVIMGYSKFGTSVILSSSLICDLFNQIPFHLITRLWDTYLAEGDALPDFLVYIFASFLLTVRHHFWDSALI